MANATSAASESRHPEEAPRYSGRLLLRMAPELHAGLAERAERDGVSLNHLITRLLADGLASAGDGASQRGSRPLRIALAVNLALVSVLAAAAIVLVVAALRATG